MALALLPQDVRLPGDDPQQTFQLSWNTAAPGARTAIGPPGGQPRCSMTLVVGFDGCRRGWIGCLWHGPGSVPDPLLLPSLRDSEERLPRETAAIAIDMPLGLLDVAAPGGRRCDMLARQRLGKRASCVFSPPARPALVAADFDAANRLNRDSGPARLGISRQAFGIFPKLRDADEAVAGSAWLRQRVIEAHPEVCFQAMAASPVVTGKKTTAGRDERQQHLRAQQFERLDQFVGEARRLGAAVDDALDACAAAWTAWRWATGAAMCLPVDADGPPHAMRIWI
jgi:predicted RNase H-like nuclease